MALKAATLSPGYRAWMAAFSDSVSGGSRLKPWMLWVLGGSS